MLNPAGLGDAVGDSVYFDPWLTCPLSVYPFQPPIQQPTITALLPPYPNPFNPKTAISYKLQATSFVNLTVYDIAGRKVAELVNGWRDAGVQEVHFAGADLPSGVYIAHLEAGNVSTAQKLVLMK